MNNTSDTNNDTHNGKQVDYSRGREVMALAKEKQKPVLLFCGGVGSVTGANFLLAGPDGINILVDCGLEQGSAEAREFNGRPFIYNPADCQFLLVTHAHLDHIGRIPKLVKDGFSGKIISTPETKALTEIMLQDALKLITQEASKDESGKDPMYNEADVAKSMSLWSTVPYHTKHVLSEGYEIYIKDSGHILGAGMYELHVKRGGFDRKILFTGDLGNSPTPLLKDTESIEGAEYLIMESVYGDKNHEDRASRKEKLADALIENHKKHGVLLIPAFSLEKTQELLFEIHTMIEKKKIPVTPLYLDSPLAIKVTELYKKMEMDFKPEALAEAKKHDIFSFPGLRISDTADQSKLIVKEPSPKIIVAGSGMSNGGRIVHHELEYLDDPNNTILFLGFQAAGTLGRQIKDGAREITVYGKTIPVKAKIKSIDGYSSHKDSDHLVDFVETAGHSLKKAFVVMGEPNASLFLAQRLRDYLGVIAVHPSEGDFEILD